MADFIKNPDVKITIDGTDYTNENGLAISIEKNENAVGTATVTLDDISLFPTIQANSVVVVKARDKGRSYPTLPLFDGVVRFPMPIRTKNNSNLTLSCIDNGFGFGRMLVVDSFGSQSIQPTLSTVQTIAQDVITNSVNKKFGGAASGYTYVASIEEIDVAVPYISWGYKPALRVFNDLLDIATASRSLSGYSGAHWIITTDNHVRMKYIGTSQEQWTKYYKGIDNTAEQASLVYGEDYLESNLQQFSPEYSSVLFYGTWQNPSNGDSWTESHTNWGYINNVTLSTETSLYIAGEASVKAELGGGVDNYAYYPSGQDAAWDFSGFTNPKYIPTLNFTVYRSGLNLLKIFAATDATHYSEITLYNPLSVQLDAETWVTFSIPVGEYWKSKPNNSWNWSSTSSPNPVDWGEVNYIQWYINGLSTEYLLIDGMNFSGVPVCRVATNSNASITGQLLITDNQAKYDSLVASDDSGTLAQLALAELLRQQYTPTTGIIKAQFMPEALPGQLFNIDGTDYRATKIKHDITGNDEFTTTLTVTTDLFNSMTRPRYEDMNRLAAANRPEWQDRQASNIKAGDVDPNVARLEKQYALSW